MLQKLSYSGIVLLLAFTVLTAEPSFEIKPGHLKSIPCVGASERTIDLYIPAAYMKETERKFPVLFMSSPGGNPRVTSQSEWAERQGVILVGINSSKNGPTANNDAAQEAALKTIEPALRLHPCLRFAMGMSGGAQASWALATRHAGQFAGIVMEGQCGFENPPPKHILIAYINGDKDPNADWIARAITKLKRNGNTWQHFTKPGGHIPGTVEEEVKYLDWMLDTQRLTHPLLPADEKARVKTEAIAALESVAKIADAKARAAVYEKYLSIPGASQYPQAMAHFSRWVKAVLEVASSAQTPMEKYAILWPALDRDWHRAADSASRNAFDNAVNEIKKDAAVKAEFDAEADYNLVAHAEKMAGAIEVQLQGAQKGYAAVAQRYPGARAGITAAEDAKRLLGYFEAEKRVRASFNK